MTLRAFFPMNTYSEDPAIKQEEASIAVKVVEGKKHVEDFSLYNKSLQRLNELKVLNISGSFICVGCGPLPTTLIFAKKNYVLTRLIGIDIDPKALSLAGRVYSYLFGETIETGESLKEFNFQKHDEPLHFFVANMVKPKSEILSSIHSLANKDSIVIVREPSSTLSSDWESISDNLNPTEWKIMKKFQSFPHFASRSILLTKATNS